MNEIEIKSNVKPGVIEFNNEEIKQNIIAQVEEFKGATFSEESITLGKVIVADLRKRVKEAKEVDKSVKVEYMKPYDEFHKKVTELTGLIEKPINDINIQLEEMEQQRIVKKKESVAKLYDEIQEEIKEYIPLEKIYNPKWDNKTFTISNVKKEIETLVETTTSAIATISRMNSEAVEEALNRYKSDLSVVNAIAYINEYEQKKIEILAREKARLAEEEERKRQAEINRIREEERGKIREEEEAKLEKERVEREQQEAIEKAKEEERSRIEAEQEQARQAMQVKKSESSTKMENYKIIATDEEFGMLEMYLNSIGVEYIKGNF